MGVDKVSWVSIEKATKSTPNATGHFLIDAVFVS